MNRHCCGVITLVLLAGLFTGSALSQNFVVITRAVPDLEGSVLNLEGINFQEQSRVFMGAVGSGLDELSVLSTAPTRIEAQLLSTAPGSYLLLVINPGIIEAAAPQMLGSPNLASLVVTLGAEGPPGPQGPQGPEGPPGLSIPEVVRWGDSTDITLGLHYVIAVQGVYPPRDDPSGMVRGVSPSLSTDPLLGSIALFAGNFAPRGWMFCDGQLLFIQDNAALFSLVGTTYGGDGITTFALPDLRGRVPVHRTQ